MLAHLFRAAIRSVPGGLGCGAPAHSCFARVVGVISAAILIVGAQPDAATATLPVRTDVSSGVHVMDLVLVTTTQPDDMTVDRLRQHIAETDEFYSRVTLGRTRLRVGKTFDWVSVPRSSPCDLNAARRAGAKAAGFEGVLAGPRHTLVVYLAKNPQCPIGGGQAFIKEIVLRGSYDAMNHEFGHTIGLGHANRLQCVNAQGSPVSDGPNVRCLAWSYGNRYDLMGSGPPGSGFSLAHLVQLGAVPLRDVPELPAGDSTVTINRSSLNSGTRGYRAVAGSRTTVIEYRAETISPGWDDPGVLLTVSDPGLPHAQPETGSGITALVPLANLEQEDTDFTLDVGQTFRSYDGRLSARTVAMGPDTAEVAVHYKPLPRFPAKLQVLRAGVRGGKLDVFARITERATGDVEVSYESSGKTTRFMAAINSGTIRIARGLPSSQRSKSTGILSMTYDGNDRVQSDEVRLRAASGKALLKREASIIDSAGRLRVSGTISKRARGVVRLRLGYSGTDEAVQFLEYTTMIDDGRWSLTKGLPSEVAKAGGQLSIQYTGYEPRRIRGEQLAKAVKPDQRGGQ